MADIANPMIGFSALVIYRKSGRIYTEYLILQYIKIGANLNGKLTGHTNQKTPISNSKQSTTEFQIEWDHNLSN